MPYYRTTANLNLYKSSACDSLVTQAAIGRYLYPTAEIDPATDSVPAQAIPVVLVEDDYPGWVAAQDWQWVEAIDLPDQAPVLTEAEIRDRLPQVLEFTQAAHQVPNHYLWGGTVAPDYDCSGLMQAAFRSAGIQIPRDAYQQEAFVATIALEALQPGDLIFFGTPEKATHVALYLGDRRYIHSSGKDQGRDGIGIDLLSAEGDEVSRRYYAQLRGAGRVVASYQPTQLTPSSFGG